MTKLYTWSGGGVEGASRQRQTRSIGRAIKTPFLVYSNLYCFVSAMFYTLAFRINFLRCYIIKRWELTGTAVLPLYSVIISLRILT